MSQPINLTDSLSYAGFWRRLASVLVDGLILLPIVGLTFYLSFKLTHGGDLSLHALNADPWLLYNPAATIALDLAIFALVVCCWVRFCGTPGKLLLGCQVVDANSGRPLSIARAMLRYFAYLASALPLTLGFLWIAFDPRKQGFHDKIAGSIVILEDESTKTLQQLQQEMR